MKYQKKKIIKSLVHWTSVLAKQV